MKINLLGKTLQQISDVLSTYDFPAYYAREIALWMYRKGESDFDNMSNISKKNREILKEHFTLGYQPPVNVQSSADGTKKYLFEYGPLKFIETAYIPDDKRHTLCVSSQVGCKMNCQFCMTARQGFQKDLSAGEIINQIVSIPERELITNLVFMGMGEPFDNLNEVLYALEIITAEYGLAIGSKRITVSTIGIIPGMVKFIEQTKCNLAISLHSPFDEERERLIPIQKRYPIQKVIDVLKQHPFERHRQLSFEYILFKGLNDTPEHIKGLTRLLGGLRCKINLMAFHSIPGTDFRTSTRDDLMRFRDQLDAKGITTTVRLSRGEDIQAACGLLSTAQKVKTQPTA